MSMYKKISLANIHKFQCSEQAAKSVIDWRIASKKGVSQGVFNNALKVAVECLEYGYDCVDDVLLRWEESGWTGIKYVKMEAQREMLKKPIAGNRSTRDMSLHEELGDISWGIDAPPMVETKQLN